MTNQLISLDGGFSREMGRRAIYSMDKHLGPRDTSFSSVWSFFKKTESLLSQFCLALYRKTASSLGQINRFLLHLGTSPLRNSWDPVNFPTNPITVQALNLSTYPNLEPSGA